LIQRRCIPKHGKEVQYHVVRVWVRKTGDIELTRFGLDDPKRQHNSCLGLPTDHLRHPHWKAVNHHMGVEWLQNISREQAMIDGRVFVFLELGQLILSYVHHSCSGLAGAKFGFVGVVVGSEVVKRVVFRGRVWPKLVIAHVRTDDVTPRSMLASKPGKCSVSQLLEKRYRGTSNSISLPASMVWVVGLLNNLLPMG
jgi:hypothetical protein